MAILEGKAEAKFFEYGEVSVDLHDNVGRKASLHVCMPCCLMQAVTPVLLGAGFIDKYEIRSPLVVWIPSLPLERFRDEVSDSEPEASQKAFIYTSDVAKSNLDLFSSMSHILKDPSDMVPLLPMGTYVTFQYQCKTDSLGEVLIKLMGVPISGIPEFQFALATVLAFLLKKEGPPVNSLPKRQ